MRRRKKKNRGNPVTQSDFIRFADQSVSNRDRSVGVNPDKSTPKDGWQADLYRAYQELRRRDLKAK